jgi:[ribosomal protein S5]-alanine N-acetyltransferase
LDTLTTTRLLLRPFRLDDFEAHYAMVGSDPNVTWQRQVHSRDQAHAALLSRMRHWHEHGFGMWAVIERTSDQLIGHGGLQYLEQTSVVELGYYLGQPAWGFGFASELGRAVLAYGFEQLHLSEVVAVVRPENQASQRVLTKLGFHTSHTADHYGFEVQYWRLPAADFKPQPGTYSVRAQ